jgi:hypothetical protein
MEECKPVFTPSTSESPQTSTEITKAPYKEAVGALMYLANASRPDIAYATRKVARSSASPKNEDWMGVKRIFSYLKGSPNIANTTKETTKSH